MVGNVVNDAIDVWVPESEYQPTAYLKYTDDGATVVLPVPAFNVIVAVDGMKHDTLPFHVVPFSLPSYPVVNGALSDGHDVNNAVLSNVPFHMGEAPPVVGEPFAINPANVDGGI